MAEADRAHRVSAIIVVRNGMPFITEALESVRSQTLDDWELLVVDDGSTDETPDVIRRIAADDPARIRLLAHPGHRNLGIAASRNLGIEAARGRYVAFLDADDIWLPLKLAEQVAMFEADPALGMAYGRTLIWHEWEPDPPRTDYYYELGVDADARYDPPALFELLMENRAQTPTTCNAMIRASLFRKIGRFDPDARGMFEDLSFFGKATALAPTFVSDRTWAKYRQHAASCTALSAASGSDEWARLRALRRLQRALAAHDPSERALAALRGAQRQALAQLAGRLAAGRPAAARPLVTRASIITPFLDAEAFLREAIDSVRAQTVSDWELLLVDDGSGDASASIARSAASGDPRIRLLTRPPRVPGGAAAARNLGIAAAAGDYLAFLDADDLLEPDMLAVTLDAAARRPSAAMIFGPTLWWPMDGGGGWLEPTDGREGRVHRPPALLRSLILLEQGQVPCTCSVLARRSAVQAVGGFEERFRLYEDQTLWVKLFSRYDAYVTPVPLSRYRQHPESASARAAEAGEYDRTKAHAARRAFLGWVEDYLRAAGLRDPALLRAVRLARSPYRSEGSLRDWIDRRALGTSRRLWRLRRRLLQWRTPRLPSSR